MPRLSAPACTLGWPCCVLQVDVSMARQMTFTGTRDELRARLDAFEAAGATGVIFGTSGADVERELHAFAEVAGL